GAADERARRHPPRRRASLVAHPADHPRQPARDVLLGWSSVEAVTWRMTRSEERRTSVRYLAALLVAAATAGAPALAEEYPSKPIHAIYPLGAGGLGDTVLRALAQELTKAWGQAVVVENRPGANGMIGGRACATAPADGYTICLLPVDTLSYGPHLYKN